MGVRVPLRDPAGGSYLRKDDPNCQLLHGKMHNTRVISKVTISRGDNVYRCKRWLESFEG